jgi:hypothetical protein
MAERIEELEARVEALTQALRAVEGRLAAVEGRGPASAARRRRPSGVEAGAPPAATLATELSALTRGLALAGRLLLVLAGAFLLRALTEAGTLPGLAGAGLGLAYAAGWLVAADRAAARGQGSSAAWHAGAAAIVALPLLVEGSARLGLLAPAWAMVGAAAFGAATLGIATRRRLEALAWIAVISGVSAALAFAVTGAGLAGPVLYLVALGVATLWIGYVIDWKRLRWPVAVAADLLALALALQASRSEAPWSGAALGVLAVLVVGYLGSVSVRTLWLGRAVVPFEVAQAIAVVAVGLGGAAWVAARSAAWTGGLGAGSVAVGLAAYGVAFAFVERHQQQRANFYFYTSIAILFLVAGTGLALGGAGRALAWAGLAIASGVLARLLRRRTLAVHAAIYGCAAALGAGLLGEAVAAAFGSVEGPWGAVPVPAGVVLIAVALAAWLTADPAPARGVRERLPRLALVAALAVAAAGVVLRLLVPVLAVGADGTVNAAAAATVRTAVLAAGAIALAWAGRAEAWREAGWLAYPLVALTGLKLLLEDLARGRPATLVVAFALYGAALIAVPRLRRRGPTAARAAG